MNLTTSEMADRIRLRMQFDWVPNNLVTHLPSVRCAISVILETDSIIYRMIYS